MSVHKKIWLIGWLMLAVIMFAACQSNNQTNTEGDQKSEHSQQETANATKQKQQNESTEQKQTSATQPDEPTYIYPLTGLPADHKVMRRPVSVMVNNHPKARPQSGVYAADIVYEMLTEGQITRFLAIFQSKTPKILGPVRSARPYFIRISNGFDAIYVHHGWSPQAKALLHNSDTDNLNGLFYDGTLFHRADFREAPHNSYIPYKNVIKGAKQKGYELKAAIKPLPFLSEKQVAHISGAPGHQVTINYAGLHQVKFVYKPEDGTYQRYSDGEKTVDRETNIAVDVENVMIVEAPHRFIDSYPRREINFHEGGEAWLFQKGTVQKIHWQKINGRILPVKNGEVVGFVPGQTWVNVIPTDPGLEGAAKIIGGEKHAN